MSLPFDPAMLPPDMLGGGPIPGMMGPPVSGPALPGPMPGLGGPGPMGPPMLGGPPMPPPMDPMMGPLPPPMPAPGMPMPGMPPNPMMGGGMPPNPTMLYLAAIMQQEMQDNEGSAPDTKPKKPKRKKPNLDDLKEKADRIVEFWALRDTRMDEDLAMYRLTKEETTDGEVVLKNTPFVVVEKAANLISAQMPSIQVIPPDEEVAEEAQKIEDFLRWSGDQWNKVGRRNLNGSMRHDMAHFLCLRGWVAARVWYDSEEEDPNEHPIRVKLFDPRQVYPKMGDKRLQYVVHRYWTTYGELQDEYPDEADTFKESEPNDFVEVTAYYDDWYHAVWTEEADLKPVTEHEYGFIPWVITIGNGAPIRATSNNQTSWVKDHGVSIFHGIKDSYKQLNKVLSQLATQVATASNPPTVYYYDPVMNKTPQPLDYTPGTTNFLLYDRERVDPLNLTPNPTNTQPLIDALVDDTSKGSLPEVLWGLGGGESGFGTSMMTDAARDQLSPVVDAMTTTFEMINEYTLRLIRDLHEDDIGFWITDDTGRKMGGITLSPEEIEAVGVNTEVIYRDISPKDRASMAQIAAMLVDKKLISMETAREEYLMLENPERENQRVLQDLIYQDEDLIKKGLVPAALARANPDLFAYYMMSKQQELFGQQQGGPPQGPPGAPPGMPPGPQGPPGLPPTAAPPIGQPGADPFMQSLGSAIGGAGLGPPPGIGGAPMPLPPGLPMGLSLGI